MFNEFSDVLTVTDLMKALNIGRNKAYSMLQHKVIKCFKIGKCYKIPKQYLIEYVLKVSA